MRIETATDWSAVANELMKSTRGVPHNPDLSKLLANIDDMVTKLSKAEVIARRMHQTVDSLPELKEVNEAIDTFEQWLMIAILSA